MSNSTPLPSSPNKSSALDRARRKAYWRLLPILFLCYVIAYVDRSNVGIAKLTMTKDLPGFDNAVIGFGAGVFFWGYFILEIPGTLLIEKWSARKWLSRIMITWGICAGLTALVKTPMQFYVARFTLGLAEAGFFPGVIVYLTHWFPARDRTRALAYFLVATPIAQITSPKISNALLKIGMTEQIDGVMVHHDRILGYTGWQWVYLFWGAPAVILGIVVLVFLKDRPKEAKWLTDEEKEALQSQLDLEKQKRASGKRLSLAQAFSHPKVLLLTLAYFCCVAVNYSLDFFLPTILQKWYSLKLDAITWLVILPPIGAIVGQLVVGWTSDRARERRLHAVIPILLAAVAIAAAPMTQGNLSLTILCFVFVAIGLKSYLPAFWALPSIFLTETAAAGSIGLINSLGNLGGSVGPTVVGYVEKITGSFVGGIYFLAVMLLIAACVLYFLGLGKRGSEA